MKFTIEFYEISAGGCPVQDFLDLLRKTDPGDFAAALSGLDKLRDKKYHQKSG